MARFVELSSIYAHGGTVFVNIELITMMREDDGGTHIFFGENDGPATVREPVLDILKLSEVDVVAKPVGTSQPPWSR